MADDFDAARAILKGNFEQLLARSNVVATGVGYKVSGGKRTNQLSIVCSVVDKTPVSALSAKDLVPKELDSMPTDVVRIGKVRALAHTGRFRPAPGGVSIGHVEITAGTLGCLVKKGGQTFILSNNHVLANSNDATVGDPIVQPGPLDGGRVPQDQIATLADFVPIQFPTPGGGGSCAGCSTSTLNMTSSLFGQPTRFQSVLPQAADNLVDCAIAGPVDPDVVSNEILDIGPITGVAQATLGMPVKKNGRTTEFTTGEILQVDVTVNVDYREAGVGRFTDQLLAGPMSAGGDSGSAVLNDNNEIVGLLFAGSDSSTIINPIQAVFSALGVTL